MTDIEPIIKKMVVNAVTGTPGQSAFKERELRQRLVPELVAAVMENGYDADAGRFAELVSELTGYLPAAIQNQALSSDPPRGDGTLSGFRSKVAEVFRLGLSAGWTKAQR